MRISSQVRVSSGKYLRDRKHRRPNFCNDQSFFRSHVGAAVVKLRFLRFVRPVVVVDVKHNDQSDHTPDCLSKISQTGGSSPETVDILKPESVLSVLNWCSNALTYTQENAAKKAFNKPKLNAL